MSNQEPKAELSTVYSEPGTAPRPWADVDQALTEAEMFWLSTTRRDGSPHVTPLPAVWLDGTLYFCSGEEEQKAVNLRAEPRCVLTTGTDRIKSGLDVVVEGAAQQVADTALLERLAGIWKSKLDWDYSVVDGRFQQSDGHQAPVFGVAPVKILAFGKSPYTQTRYRFADA